MKVHLGATAAIATMFVGNIARAVTGGATAGGTPPAGTPHSLGGPVIGFRGSTTTP